MLRENSDTGCIGRRGKEGSSGSTGVAKRKWLGETGRSKDWHQRQQLT